MGTRLKNPEPGHSRFHDWRSVAYSQSSCPSKSRQDLIARAVHSGDWCVRRDLLWSAKAQPLICRQEESHAEGAGSICSDLAESRASVLLRSVVLTTPASLNPHFIEHDRGGKVD